MSFILLQAANPSAMLNFLFPLLMIAIFYFFMMRPQMNRQKEQQKFVDSLQKGTEIVTASGIIGRINKIEGHIVTLQLDDKTFIRVLKSTISKDMTDGLTKKA